MLFAPDRVRTRLVPEFHASYVVEKEKITAQETLNVFNVKVQVNPQMVFHVPAAEERVANEKYR